MEKEKDDENTKTMYHVTPADALGMKVIVDYKNECNISNGWSSFKRAGMICEDNARNVETA
jgi:hypothetical protein